jgi:hypothetical protein
MGQYLEEVRYAGVGASELLKVAESNQEGGNVRRKLSTKAAEVVSGTLPDHDQGT